MAEEKKNLMRSIGCVAVAVGTIVCLTAAVAPAQTTSQTTETKTFQVIAVEGNELIVRLPEGTRQLDVPDDFRLIVNGTPLSVHELKPGMTGTATITTTTTTTPVTVTEIENGTVAHVAGSTIIVRTDEGYRSFTQDEIDKRGVKIYRSGMPAEISNFRAGDRLSATIVTTMPPTVVTEQEVQATVAAAAPAAPAPSAPAVAASAAPGVALPVVDPATIDTTLWSEERIKAWKSTLNLPSPAPLAILRIPRIRLEVPVLEGTDDFTLDRAVGHIEGTPLPGMDGNSGIAGHRDGFFRGLKDIGVGDAIEIETLQEKKEIYQITHIWIVTDDNVWVLDPTPTRALTLVSCYPFYFVGPAPKRFIVRAVLVDTTTTGTQP
jgi:LPXTG-site transpeptidase (sortase) family protein